MFVLLQTEESISCSTSTVLLCYFRTASFGMFRTLVKECKVNIVSNSRKYPIYVIPMWQYVLYSRVAYIHTDTFHMFLIFISRAILIACLISILYDSNFINTLLFCLHSEEECCHYYTFYERLIRIRDLHLMYFLE